MNIQKVFMQVQDKVKSISDAVIGKLWASTND